MRVQALYPIASVCPVHRTADEIETSMMLYIDPSSVDMSKAVKDYTPSTGTGLLNRRPGGTGTYSRTGIWGDPTRATREKGRIFVEALVGGILDDIAALRTAALPTQSAAAGSAAEPTRPAAPPTPADKLPAAAPTTPAPLPKRPGGDAG